MSSSKVSPMSPRLQSILKDMYGEAIKQRKEEIYTIIADFSTQVLSSKLDLNNKFALIPNVADISHLVNCYFLDVIKYKEYHFTPKVNGDDGLAIHRDPDLGGKYIDDAKQAALMVKWIVKIKPLIIIPRKVFDRSLPTPVTTEDQENIILTINELFAVAYASAVLGINNIGDDSEFIDRLIYNLHYRSYDEGVFAEFFNLMSCKFLAKLSDFSEYQPS